MVLKPVGSGPSVPLLGELALICGSTFAVMGLFGVGLILPGLKAGFAGTAQAVLVPWVATLVGPAFALSSPLAAWAIEKYGYRQIYCLSIILYVAAGAAPVLISNLWIIVPLRVVLGIATGGAVTAALDGIGRLPPARRSLLFGLQTFAGSVFSLAAFPLIGYLARFGWHLPFAIYLFGLAILPMALILPRFVGASHAADADVVDRSTQGILTGVSAAVLLLGGTVGLIMFAASVFSPVYLGMIGITKPQYASIALTVSVFMTILSSGAYGFVQRWRGTESVFVLSLGCIAPGLIVCGFSSSLWMFIIGLVGYGTGIGLCAPNVYTWAVENGSASPGRMAGIVNVAYYLTPLAFPFLFGAIGGGVQPGRIYVLLGTAAAVWAIWLTIRLASGKPRQMHFVVKSGQ